MNIDPKVFVDCRQTDDGLLCIVDAIAVFKQCSIKNAHKYLSRLEESQIAILPKSQFVDSPNRQFVDSANLQFVDSPNRQFVDSPNPQKCGLIKTHQFKKSNGELGKTIGVATFSEIKAILSQLPGKQARKLRQEQSEITSRVIAGDPDVIEAAIHKHNSVSENIKNIVMNGLETSARNKLSINMEPYTNTDIVYSIEFKPVLEGLHVPVDINRNYYTLGQTSNIEHRFNQYSSDKQYTKARLDMCLNYQNGYLASKGEKYFKNIVKDMDLKVKYYNKSECFMATEKELQELYKLVANHNKNLLSGNNNDTKLELEKYRMDKENEKYRIDKDNENEKYRIDKDKENEKYLIDKDKENEKYLIDKDKENEKYLIDKDKEIELEKYRMDNERKSNLDEMFKNGTITFEQYRLIIE